LTATSADGCCTKWRGVAVVGVGGGLGELAEGAPEEVDGVTLEAEADVYLHDRGDADVGVAEEFLDNDEFDALFQEKRRGRARRRSALKWRASSAVRGLKRRGLGVQVWAVRHRQLHRAKNALKSEGLIYAVRVRAALADGAVCGGDWQAAVAVGDLQGTASHHPPWPVCTDIRLVPR